MTALAPSVCLITPGHVASTPRIVKEADTLVDAGFRTHVVSARTFAPVDPLDAEILARARWTSSVVDCLRSRGGFARQLIRRCARMAMAGGWRTLHVAARAQNAATSRFTAAATAVPADLYLGHCLAGLPAAALAAQARRAHYGFDAEDFHDAETETALTDPVERIVTQTLQRHLLPGCAHLTAASPLIGERYRRDYGVNPTTVLNVFPRAHARSQIPPEPISDRRPARLYWFSQTVGAGRGLEEMAGVIARMKTPVEWHLRGFASPGYAENLQSLANLAGMRRPIVFLPPAAPGEMVSLAATADLGLSIERSQPLNRDLCLTNKIFVYLLAGIPQLLSPTTAQKALAPELGRAALLLDPHDPLATATALDAFFADPPRVAEGRRTAWQLAQNRFCWDLEQDIFLRSVHHALAKPD